MGEPPEPQHPEWKGKWELRRSSWGGEEGREGRQAKSGRLLPRPSDDVSMRASVMQLTRHRQSPAWPTLKFLLPLRPNRMEQQENEIFQVLRSCWWVETEA